MSHSQWKKFQFFEASYVGNEPQPGSRRSTVTSRSSSVIAPIEELDPSQVKNLSEIAKMKYVTNILGIFYVGMSSGYIFSCFGDEVKSYNQVHAYQLFYMTKDRKLPYLLTIGLDDSEFTRKGFLKVWDASDPMRLYQMCGFILPDAVIKDATCFQVSPDMNKLAIGLKQGQVYLLTGDILSGSKFTSKKILNIGEKKAPITNLQFLKRNNSWFLFFTTMASVGSFYLRDKAEVLHDLEDEDGCAHLCADVDEKKDRLVVGMAGLDAVTAFYPEFKGQTWSFEGEKTIIKCFRNQVVVVSVIKNQHQVAIYDIDNKFIGFMSTYTQVDHVLCEEDSIFILFRNNKKEIIIQKLVEKDTTEKLAILFKKNTYDIAYNLARAEGFEDSFVAEISRMQGDHYYNKGDFDNAINCYKQTVGYLEASYVIIQFLDPSKIEYLTNYLEHLHSRHQANNEHTALLLNCYVHLKATDQLNSFLEQSDEDYELFDAKTAINVCCEARCYKLALNLAEKHKMHSLYVKIRVDEQKKYLKAIKYMKNCMSISGAAKAIKEHGQVLIKHEKSATKDFLFEMVNSLNLRVDLNSYIPESEKDEKPKKEEEDDLYSEQKGPLTLTYRQVLECIMSALVNAPEVLDEVLSSIVKKTPEIDQFVYHSLFELYLQQAKPQRDQESTKSLRASMSTLSRQDYYEIVQYEQKINDLLESANNRYDKHHVLMLFKMYDYERGVVYLCQLMDNKQELMYHYIKNNEVENIWNTCMRYGKEDNDLWVQALTHFCDSKKKAQNNPQKNLEYIEKILHEIEHKDFLAPLIVLEILSKNKKITFGIIKNYLKKQLKRMKREADSDQKELQENLKSINQKKKEIHELKTQARKFQSTKCANCEGKLSLPSMHFMCMHSYHLHCLTDGERRCQRCADLAIRAAERREEFMMQSKNHETFFKELESSEDRFETIAKYYGRGLFSN